MINDQNTGLDSPDIVIDFGDNLFSVPPDPVTIIDNQFLGSGVSFGPTYTYNDTDTSYSALTQGYLENSNASNEPGSIFFSVDVTAAAFSWRTSNTTTTFEAFYKGSLVEKFTPDTNMSLSGGRYYGFENILFDEIHLSITDSNKAFTLDNLQYISAVPVPAAVWLFGSGLLGLVGVARRKR